MSNMIREKQFEGIITTHQLNKNSLDEIDHGEP